jgi:two-component system, chemotaxis family, chemotaxis protein CheY
MSDDASAKDVIIADNDYIVRGILRSVLEGGGFTVLQTTNGVEAIDYATRTRACLVILDYKMPRLDGISACTEIRHLPDYSDIPILILTAFDDEETRTAARQAGVTAFLAKPFKSVDLLRVVADLLEPSPADGGTAPEPVTLVWKRRPEPSPLFGEPVELSKGRRVLGICRR